MLDVNARFRYLVHSFAAFPARIAPMLACFPGSRLALLLLMVQSFLRHFAYLIRLFCVACFPCFACSTQVLASVTFCMALPPCPLQLRTCLLVFVSGGMRAGSHCLCYHRRPSFLLGEERFGSGAWGGQDDVRKCCNFPRSSTDSLYLGGSVFGAFFYLPLPVVFLAFGGKSLPAPGVLD